MALVLGKRICPYKENGDAYRENLADQLYSLLRSIHISYVFHDLALYDVDLVTYFHEDPAPPLLLLFAVPNTLLT